MRLFCLMFIAFSFASATHAEVLATIGNAKISTEDFLKRFDDIRKQAINPPTSEQFLEDMVRFEIGVQEAEKLQLQNDPIVRERFKQILYNALLEKKIGERVEQIKITEKEMRDYYKKNPEIRIAHILIDVKEDAKPEARSISRKRAEEIWAEVRKSKRPFEELVKIYSDDAPTKEAGGDIGFQSKITLSPLIYDAAANMKVGEVKGVIETRFGFHVIKLLERREFDLADKHQIRAALFDDKRAKIFNDYFDKTKKSYRVNINRKALQTVIR